MYKNNGTEAQQWKVSHDSKGYVKIENVKSGKVLDVYDGKIKNGNNIQQYAFHDSDAQKWIAVNMGDGYKLVSALDPNYALDLASGKAVNEMNIQLYTYNNSWAQKWVFKKDRTKMDRLAKENQDALHNGVYTIQSKKNENYVLDVKGGSYANGANVQLYRNNGTEAQQWKVSHDSKGYVKIENVKSGKVLDVKNGKAKNRSNIQQYNSNSSDAQKWVAIEMGDSYKLVSALDTDYVLDLESAQTVSGANIQLYTSNQSWAQRWIFKRNRKNIDQLANKNKNVLKNGIYVIQSKINKNYVLDVKGGSYANGANVQLYKNNKTLAQRWKISHDSQGYVRIENAKSGKVLDVREGKSKNGTNIQQYASNQTNAQKWIALKDNGSYQFVSALDPECVLDLAGGNVESGANIQLYKNNHSSAQKWILKEYSGQCISFAHRGLSSRYPENTMLAYKKAIEAGSDGIELDVQMTKDNVPVLIHDETINRTCNNKKKGYVRNYTYQKLSKIDFSYKFAGQVPFQKIPTLEEYFKLVKDLPIVTNIELKTNHYEYPGIERAVYNLIRKYHMQDKVIISSFNYDSVLRIKNLDPSLKCGFLAKRCVQNAGQFVSNNGLQCYNVGYTSLDNAAIAELKKHKISIYAWTVNDPDDIRKLINMGVDGIISNYPDRVNQCLREEGLK